MIELIKTYSWSRRKDWGLDVTIIEEDFIYSDSYADYPVYFVCDTTPQ